MTNYTKTTDFAAKDALPSGNSAKIVKGSEIDTEFNNIATASATKANANDAALTGTTTFETISDGTIAITAFVDEDNMASNSATLLPTQQSVKAYVDSQVTAQDLDFQADSGGALSIDLDSETLTFTGGTGVDTSGSGNAVTFAIDSTVATLTGSQTLSNKTLATPVVSGNLTTDGLIDGRDIATDGTKLDGIEAGATADQTAAEIRTLVESATDSNVFTDADHSKLNGIEASADVTDTANVTAAGALMDSELTSEASVKALNQGVATTDSPTFAGLTTTGNISFGDNDKAIFGDGSDLEIFHSGSHSIIRDNGTGDLRIEAADDIFLRSVAGEVYARFRENLGAELYYDNAQKFATTSTGIDVTGTVTADGLTVDGSTQFNTGAAGIAEFYHTSGYGGIKATGSASGSGATIYLSNDKTGTPFDMYTIFADGSDDSLQFWSGGNPSSGTKRFNAASNGDISFYEDTGTTPKLFWDASAEKLGLGTTSPAEELDISADAPSMQLSSTNASGRNYGLQSTNTGKFAFYDGTAGANRIIIDSSGRVGIGTSSPANLLHIRGGAATLEIDSSTNTANLDFDNNTQTARIQLANNDLATLVGGTERMRIDSSGNVGIGTSSPAATLDVVRTGAGIQDTLQLRNAQTLAAGVGSSLGFGDSGGARLAYIAGAATGANNDNGYLSFYTRASDSLAERMRIDSSGNVGIGTSPNAIADLHVADTSDARIWLDATSGDTMELYSGTGVGMFNRANSHLIFGTNNAEKMRIDSSGNLLVGKSSADNTTAGTTIYGDPKGAASFVRDAGNTLVLNRLTNDGEIVALRKDGTTVGSIGTKSGDLAVGTGDTGLRFDDANNAIYAHSMSANGYLDATVDLGYSGIRFKDLYLSGGVYLGGTGSANHLDDYEEGTFTLSASAGTLTYLYSSTSTYTKIGNRVIIDLGQLQITGVPNNTSVFVLTGLPFATQGQSAIPTGWVNTQFGTSGATQWFNMYVESSQIYISKRNTSYLLTNADITGGTYQFSGGGSAYRTT